MLLGATLALAAAPSVGRAAERALQARDAVQSTADTTARVDATVSSESPRATRADLTAALQRAERNAARGSAADQSRAQRESAAIRARLRDGDFHPGDRIAMSVSGDSTGRELTLREGLLLELPYGIPSLSLAGVLRSEVSDVLIAHLRKYVREPDIHVRPLQRVSITGSVGRPGVYWVASDVPLAEVVMRAGGVGQGAPAERTTVTRGGKVVLDRKAYARLVREGRTVAESGLLPGDEIHVPERVQGHNWTQIATYSFFVVSALTAVLALIRSSYQ